MSSKKAARAKMAKKGSVVLKRISDRLEEHGDRSSPHRTHAVRGSALRALKGKHVEAIVEDGKIKSSRLVEQAEVFTSQTFKDGSALTSLTAKERETINTMIDFFRSSGEDENLDPEVYEAIADKLGNGRAPKAPLDEAFEGVKWLVEALWELGLDTVGRDPENNSLLDRNSAQYEMYERAKKAFFALQTVISERNRRLKDEPQFINGTLTAVKTDSLSRARENDILYACGKALAAIDGVLGADGYQSTDRASCDCDDAETSSECPHMHARKAQAGLRGALRNAGYIEDNFGAWGRP